MMLWSILILTQPSRARFLARLMAVLKPQVENHPDVEVCVRTCDRKLSLGDNRQAMIESASGVYCCFIDDDDLIPANYVDKIYPLLDGVDYIGFRLQMYSDEVKQRPTFHSLKHKEWNGDQEGWYRDISHINPIRRELALMAKMSGEAGEDCRWADALRAKCVVKTEHYIDEVLYLYYWRSNKTDSLPPSPPGSSVVGEIIQRPPCPSCGSTATGIGGGMRRCNQCQHSWI
jgi:glycosyltransferase involved in cell wall biosynthesis